MVTFDTMLTSGLLGFLLTLLIWAIKKIYCIDFKIQIIKSNDLPHLFKYTYWNYKRIKKLEDEQKGKGS